MRFLLSLFVTLLIVSACGQDNQEQTNQEQANVESEIKTETDDPSEEMVEIKETKEAEAEGAEEKVSEKDQIPTFDAYSIRNAAFEVSSELDVSKYEHATYKNLLIKGYRSVPNLAAKYIVISVPCGSNCQTNFIANKETGKIIGDIGTTLGLSTRVDSALLIADAYELPLDRPFYDNPLVNEVRYYVINNDKIKEITTISHKDYYNANQVEE